MFGRWKVLKKDGRNQKGTMMWLCECQCENKTQKLLSTTKLKNGITNSCGCLNGDSKKKYNEYELCNEYGIGYACNTGNEFYFDLEDYDKIKNILWRENKDGYISGKKSRKDKSALMHRLMMDVLNDDSVFVDHIYHNTRDNRKLQLRLASPTQNLCNSKIRINNTSGVTGVNWNKNRKKWYACLTYNKKVYSKSFCTFEEAVEYRKYLEEKYHKEFAYQEPPLEYIEELRQLSESV